MVQTLIFLLGISVVDAASGIRCRQLFTTPYGKIHSSFTHNTRYDVETTRTDIKDQCATGHCHMYTWIGDLEISTGIKIATSYLDAMHVYRQALNALKEGRSDISQGRYNASSRLDISDIGIVPLEAWRGDPDLIQSENYTKLIAGLETILVNVLEQTKGEETPRILRAIYKGARKDIDNYVRSMAGPLPDLFEYHGKKYNPHTFAKKYFPELNLPIINVEIEQSAPGVVIKHGKTKQVTEIVINWQNSEGLMTALIDSNRPFYLAYNHQAQFVDKATGIMSISAFHYPTNAKGLSREQRTSYSKWGGGHAVLVVGYQKDPQTGKVTKWKIQNSWGEKAGDQGYYHMYRDFLHTFGFGFNFAQDGLVNVAKELNATGTH